MRKVMVTAAKALLPVVLGIVCYLGFYVMRGPWLVLHYMGPASGRASRLVSRSFNAIYYPFLTYNAHSAAIIMDTGTIDKGDDGVWGLYMQIPRYSPSGPIVRVVGFRVPQKFSGVVSALKGKKVTITYGQEADPDYFSSRYLELRSIEPAP